MTSTGEQSKTRKPQTRTGVVSSISGEKSIGVLVNTLVKHPRYGKYIRRQTKLIVHDPAQKASKGDLVEISSCRPISKKKSWRLVRVVRSSENKE